MGIIKKAQRERMKDFVLENLENSGYPIQSVEDNKIIILSKKDKKLPSLTLFLHNEKRKLSDFRHEMDEIIYSKKYVSNIFYKGMFHVRLGYRAIIKGKNKGLKKYTKRDLDRMLHLRDLEKIVLSMQSPKDVLVYYQPETERLKESIRAYEMKGVFLDYSHISEKDRRYDFIESRESIDYKIAEELAPQKKNIGFEAKKSGSMVLVVNPPKVLQPQLSLL